jgi:putative ABC transport system ATP-binding protein
MIKTANLTKVFTTEEIETTALNTVNVEIQQGEFVALMGPSGCGKSTFLHITGMLDSPTDGEYYFMSEEVSRYSEKKRANLRKGNIGFVFQSFNLFPGPNFGLWQKTWDIIRISSMSAQPSGPPPTGTPVQK